MRETRTVMIEMVVPVHNEEQVLAKNIHVLHFYMSRRLALPFRITIANNASTDTSLQIALALAEELPEVEVLHLTQKGRGLALREAWKQSDAELVGYTDIDLSTDLGALPAMIGKIRCGKAEVAIGSRLVPGARIKRGPKREVLSRGYNMLLRVLLETDISDAQCGFKVARREAISPLLEEVENNSWFFDTELLHRAQQRGMRVSEVPVRWVDDKDSRVAIIGTTLENLQGIRRLRREDKNNARTRLGSIS